MAAPTIITGILTGGANSHETSSEEVNAVATDFVSEGVVGTFTNTSGVAPATGAFAVNATATPDTNINISTGVSYVTATPTSQNSQSLRVKCTVTGTLAISANSSGSTKYDWIYISVSATNSANPAVGADNVATIVASRSSSASTDDGTPPTYGYPIAVVTVSNGFSTITNGNIRDVRTNCIVNLGSSSVSSGWTDLGYNPNTVTNNGNRSYSLVFNSVNLTSTLSTKMKLKTTRLVPAPTLCTDLESSSSQYYSKTSPSGASFTDDFTCMAWVKLESHTAGGIIARRNADTEGWSLSVNSSGQVLLGAYRIASNNAVVNSYASLPLGRWVHVAANYDLSGTTANVYFDGVLVPSLKTVTGTCTALVQGTTALVVGAEKSAGTNPFDGKIAQAAVFSSVLSAATILSYMSQTLGGAENTIVSAYSFNNTINDLSSNANNLTAQGSAVATSTDSPFGGQASGSVSATLDYGAITSATFSTDTTLVVQVPEGCTIPTSGGVSAVAYSTSDTPYGIPSDENKWTIQIISLNDRTGFGNAAYATLIDNLIVPIGSWRLRLKAQLLINTTQQATRRAIITLSSDASTVTNPNTTGAVAQVPASSTSASTEIAIYRQDTISLTAQTTFTLMGLLNSTTNASANVTGATTTPTVISAMLAYL